MEHNVHIEWALNVKAYYQAYRGLCRMRIIFAKALVEDWEETYDHRSTNYETMQHQVLFWTNVYQYWEKKLEESYAREKEYLGE